MIKTSQDRQPGLGTTGISGTLTLTKTGTTARTATFPDAAITVAGLEVANVFTAAQTVPNGTAAAPGIRITTEASGLFRKGSASIGVAAAGVEAVSLFAPGSGFGGGLQFHLPVDADFGYIYTSRTNSEFRLSPGSSSTNGANIQLFGSTHATATTGRLRASTASVLEWTATGITAAQNLTIPNGTAAAPGIRTTTYAHGLHSIGATSVGIDVAGALVLTVGATASDFASGTTVTVNNTTDATTTSDGSVRLSGGLSVAANKAIVAGGNVIFATATAAATTAGTLQRETNQDKHYAYANGIGGWMDKCLFSQYATVSQAGIVTDQSLASGTARGTRTLPANFFKLGKVLKFRLCGRYTTDAAAGNATIQIKLGSTVFRTTGSFSLDNSVTALPWDIECEIVCQSTGATGTIEGIAMWKHMITGATGNYEAESLGGTAAVTIDTTASQALDVIWTATDAGTTLTCTCFRMWEVC